jgi:hypothetical protein
MSLMTPLVRIMKGKQAALMAKGNASLQIIPKLSIRATSLAKHLGRIKIMKRLKKTRKARKARKVKKVQRIK